jgi:protein O-mannosyl-transferase
VNPTIGRVALLLLVAVLSSVAFLPAVSGSFLNWDDDVNFQRNVAYRGLGRDQIQWAFTSVVFGHYIPLTRLTFSLNYVLGGMNPWGYHLLNVLLHGANAALFYVVARRLLAAASGSGSQDARNDLAVSAAAAVAALVFGVHPLRVEAVAWVTGRADVLCTTFVFLATWAYLRAVEGPGPGHRGLILVAAGALAAALLSKAAVWPFSVSLLLLDVYPLHRRCRLGWWPLLREKIPLFVVTLVAAVPITYALRYGAVVTGVEQYGVVARITLAAYSFVVSAWRFLWPAALSPLYEMPTSVSPLDPRFGFAVAAAVLVTAALIFLRRYWPGGLAAWTFSALMLASTSSGVRKTTDVAPDRYSYLAGLGFALLVGGVLLGLVRFVRSGVLGRPVGWVAAVAGLAAIAGLSTESWSYSRVWREPESLWRWAVELDPTCSVCHSKLGESVLGDPAEALRAAEAENLFRRAIALRPDRPHAYFNLGTALIVQGRYAEAEAPLQRYLERVPRSADGPERLGRLYLLEQRYEAAVPMLRVALTRKPDTPGLRGYLAEALKSRARELQQTGRRAEAESLLVEARALGTE